MISLKVNVFESREAEDCMPLVLHAKCRMSVICMKVMTVDFMAEHIGIQFAQTAIIGHAVCHVCCTKYRSQKSFGHNTEASLLLRSSVTSNSSS